MERKGVDLTLLLNSMEEASVEGIDIGLEPTDLRIRTERFSAYPFIHLSAGIGPWGTAQEEDLDQQLVELESQLETFAAVAIGEIGLDNFHTYGGKERQEYLLKAQIELSNRLKKPVIFHNREADDQFSRLLEHTSFAKRGIFHCYQGSAELAHLAVEAGFFLSFAGPLTYKANSAMQKLFAELPVESLLLETDSPYLSPVPVRGTVNTPLHMQHIYEFAALLRGLSVEELATQLHRNFQVFLEQKEQLSPQGN